MSGFLRLTGKISRGEDIAVHKRDGRRTLGGRPVRHIGQVHKPATPTTVGIATITFISNTANTISQAVNTFAAQGVGAAANDKSIIVVAHAGDSVTARTVSSVTVGGAGLTKIIEVLSAQAWYGTTSIWKGVFSDGPTADIIVTFNAAPDKLCAIGVYEAHSAAASATATISVSAASNPATGTIDIPANGILVAGITINDAPGTTETWAGVTESYDAYFQNNEAYSGGAKAYESAQTSLTVSATSSGAPSSTAYAVASFAPA